MDCFSSKGKRGGTARLDDKNIWIYQRFRFTKDADREKVFFNLSKAADFYRKKYHPHLLIESVYARLHDGWEVYELYTNAKCYDDYQERRVICPHLVEFKKLQTHYNMVEFEVRGNKDEISKSKDLVDRGNRSEALIEYSTNHYVGFKNIPIGWGSLSAATKGPLVFEMHYQFLDEKCAAPALEVMNRLCAWTEDANKKHYATWCQKFWVVDGGFRLIEIYKSQDAYEKRQRVITGEPIVAELVRLHEYVKEVKGRVYGFQSDIERSIFIRQYYPVIEKIYGAPNLDAWGDKFVGMLKGNYAP